MKIPGETETLETMGIAQKHAGVHKHDVLELIFNLAATNLIIFNNAETKTRLRYA